MSQWTVFSNQSLSVLTDGFYNKMAVGQVFTFKVLPLDPNSVITITNTTQGVATLTVDTKGSGGKVACTALGNGQINVVVGTITVPIKFEIVPEFVPVTELTPDIIEGMTLHSTNDSLARACGIHEVKMIKFSNNLPTLYYIKCNENPRVYEYTVHALSSDISKFTLLKSIAGD